MVFRFQFFAEPPVTITGFPPGASSIAEQTTCCGPTITMETEDTLLEVRKAYRLIHDYQRVAMDAVSHIAQQLGLTYEGGYPKFSDPSPRRGQGELNYWAWDWLNFAFYEFCFTKKMAGGGKLMVSILLISATGYFELDDSSTAEPNGSDFPAAGKCRTEVGFVISAGKWPHPAFMESNAGMKKFIDGHGELPAEHVEAGVIGKCVSLARLMSEETTAILIDELIAFANAANIPLTRSVSNLRKPTAQE
jgi:hypothetical protein